MNYGFPSSESVKGAIINMAAFGVMPFGAVVFADAVSDGETVVIGDTTYEFDTDDDYTAGNIQVDVSGGATAADAAAALKTAINASDPVVDAADGETSNVLILTPSAAAATDMTVTVTETLEAAGNIASDVANGVSLCIGSFGYVATAADVAEGQVALTITPPGTRTLIDALVAVCSVSDGAVTKKAWDGGYTIDSGVITITNAGSTDWAAGDYIVITPKFI